MMNGNDWGWGISVMLFLLMVIVFVAVIVMRVLREHNHHIGNIQKSGPLDVVKERYAKGEITKEEFEQLKKDLE